MSRRELDLQFMERPHQSEGLSLMSGSSISIPGVFALRMRGFADSYDPVNQLYVAAPKNVLVVRKEFIHTRGFKKKEPTTDSSIGIVRLRIDRKRAEQILYIGCHQLTFTNVRLDQAHVTISSPEAQRIEVLPEEVDISAYMRGSMGALVAQE